MPIGFGLDFFAAHKFFIFPNTGATVGTLAPALGGGVPIEEYIFYFTGFVAILLIYVWLDEYWLVAYNVPDYSAESQQIDRLLKFHPESLIRSGVDSSRDPLQEAAFSLSGRLPRLLHRAGNRRPGAVGWLSACGAEVYGLRRAISLTIFVILFISMLWEATLAIPYGWWGYQPRQMMGLFIGAWAGLPVEAVVVWIAVTYATTIVYEIVKVWQASGRAARHAFLGKP